MWKLNERMSRRIFHNGNPDIRTPKSNEFSDSLLKMSVLNKYLHVGDSEDQKTESYFMSIQNVQGEEKVTGGLLNNISSWQNTGRIIKILWIKS